MARNDGVDRTIVRNHDLKVPGDVAKMQEHNEREKTNYSNQDIVPERTQMNVHFKVPTASYTEMFEQIEHEKVISTRGLKPDAVKFGELVFDVNSAYFYNHGGYEFAKNSTPTPTGPPWRLLAASNLSSPLSCTLTSETAQCPKRWARTCTTTISTSSIYPSWRSRCSGRSGVRTRA